MILILRRILCRPSVLLSALLCCCLAATERLARARSSLCCPLLLLLVCIRRVADAKRNSITPPSSTIMASPLSPVQEAQQIADVYEVSHPSAASQQRQAE